DPLADVGLLMVYWTDKGDNDVLMTTAPTALPGFPTKAELRERYAKRSGRDVSQLDFYISFGYWKLACILEGVYSRYMAGSGGGDRSGFAGMGARVQTLAPARRAPPERLCSGPRYREQVPRYELTLHRELASPGLVLG